MTYFVTTLDGSITIPQENKTAAYDALLAANLFGPDKQYDTIKDILIAVGFEEFDEDYDGDFCFMVYEQARWLEQKVLEIIAPFVDETKSFFAWEGDGDAYWINYYKDGQLLRHEVAGEDTEFWHVFEYELRASSV